MRMPALKEDQNSRGARAKPGKARYQTPVLHTFGSVAQLTAGRAGSGADRSSKRRKRRQ